MQELCQDLTKYGRRLGPLYLGMMQAAWIKGTLCSFRFPYCNSFEGEVEWGRCNLPALNHRIEILLNILDWNPWNVDWNLQSLFSFCSIYLGSTLQTQNNKQKHGIVANISRIHQIITWSRLHKSEHSSESSSFSPATRPTTSREQFAITAIRWGKTTGRTIAITCKSRWSNHPYSTSPTWQRETWNQFLQLGTYI